MLPLLLALLVMTAPETLFGVSVVRLGVRFFAFEDFGVDGGEAFMIEGHGFVDGAVAVGVDVDEGRSGLLETAFAPAAFFLHLTIYNAFPLTCTQAGHVIFPSKVSPAGPSVKKTPSVRS